MRVIKFNRIIINFKDDGTFRDGLVIYRIQNDGVLVKGFRSIAIQNVVNKPVLAGILQAIRGHVKTVEGADQ